MMIKYIINKYDVGILIVDISSFYFVDCF